MSTAEQGESIWICAPMDGWLVPLAAVPDPAFAEGMVGAGVAIDPVGGVVVAPCAGVLRVTGQRHAFTIETTAGDVLVHVGIDTVAVAGEGFELLVSDGTTVQIGDPILRLDLDRLAGCVPSLISPVLALGQSTACLMSLRGEGAVRCGDRLYALARRCEAVTSAGSTLSLRRTARVKADHGLHARPAAALVAALAPFQADVHLESRGRNANARSVTALMALGTWRGEEVTLVARGAQAAEAMAAALLQFDAPSSPVPTTLERPMPLSAPATFNARVAVRGAVVGTAYLLASTDLPIPTVTVAPAQELDQLVATLTAVRARLLQEATAQSGARRAVLEAHAAIVADPDLYERALTAIAQGANAPRAWQTATRAVIAALQASGDRRMAERTADLLDVQRRVLARLLGIDMTAQDLPVGAVVLAEDLLPSELLGLDRTKVTAVITARGGTTSHVALLAAGIGLPMLVGAGEVVLTIQSGTTLLVDGERGVVTVAPTPDRLATFGMELERRQTAAAQAIAHARESAVLRNGDRVLVECNLGGLAEAAGARDLGAEGVGLLRTEFLFLEREVAPTYEEQLAVYSSVTAVFTGHPVTIRTLDAGADKPLRFLNLPMETNPALGLRGLRACLTHPELLVTQLKALAATPGVLRILLPMVNDVGEVRAVRQLMAGIATPVTLGVMIETPASALLAESLAAEVDFFSIGSNDLAQYVLAIDRLHPTLGTALDGLHPAVLQAIHGAVQAAERAQRPVAVCGGLAADFDALPILIGLGIRELSVPAASIAAVKAVIRRLDPADCQYLALQALKDPDAATVRARVQAFQTTNGR